MTLIVPIPFFVRAYLRASTDEQDAQRARSILDQFARERGVSVCNYYAENESGARLDRPELFRLLADSRPHDVLLIEDVDRLSRLAGAEWETLKRLIRERESAVRKKELSRHFITVSRRSGYSPRPTEKIAACLNRHYPGLTAEETSLIYGSVKLAWYMDMGLYDRRLNIGKKKFASRYGFSIREMFWLAEMVTLEKMRQKDSEEIDSAKTVLKSVLKLYGNGLNDITVKNGDSDRDAYLAILLSEVF